MGIDISSSLLVGASYDELEEWIDAQLAERQEGDRTDKYDIIDQHFERASPYYDCDLDSQFIGFAIPNYQPLTEEWWEVVKEAAYQFETLTGVKPRLRGGANVW